MCLNAVKPQFHFKRICNPSYYRHVRIKLLIWNIKLESDTISFLMTESFIKIGFDQYIFTLQAMIVPWRMYWSPFDFMESVPINCEKTICSNCVNYNRVIVQIVKRLTEALPGGSALTSYFPFDYWI